MLSFLRRRREARQLLASLVEKSARYEWRARIAGGALADIEACHDAQSGALVAVKRLRRALRYRPDAVKALLREGAMLAELDHAGIPRLLDVFLLGGRPALALPFREGPTLAGRLSAGGAPLGSSTRLEQRLPMAEALEIFVHLMRALAHAHASGIAHLDLKPDNVLLGHTGDVMLVDWASACVFDPGRRMSAERREVPAGIGAGALRGDAMGEIRGTPAYMSPEQTRWPRDMLDASSDVFSSGIVLYEMITGIRPFDGPTTRETLERVRSHVPQTLRGAAPNVPERVAGLVERMLAKTPDDRPRDAGEVLATL